MENTNFTNRDGTILHKNGKEGGGRMQNAILSCCLRRKKVKNNALAQGRCAATGPVPFAKRLITERDQLRWVILCTARD